MSEFIWPLTAIVVSVIWAGAWITVERLKYDDEGFDLDAPQEEEE